MMYTQELRTFNFFFLTIHIINHNTRLRGNERVFLSAAATYLEELTKGLGEGLSEREWFQQ